MPTPQPLPNPQPYRDTRADLSDRLPAGAESRPIYCYAHFWTGWQYAETTEDGSPVDPNEYGQGKGIGEWLPSLIKATTVKGAGGAHTDRDIQSTVRRIVAKGGTVFLPGDRRLGPYADYLVQYQDVTGSLRFAEQFERAVRLPSGGIRFELADPKGARAFLRYVRDHAVEPMAAQAYSALREREAAEVERLRELSISHNRGLTQLERKERLLAAWDAAWERELARQAALTSDAPALAPAPAPADVDYTEAERIAAQAAPRRRKAPQPIAPEAAE